MVTSTFGATAELYVIMGSGSIMRPGRCSLMYFWLRLSRNRTITNRVIRHHFTLVALRCRLKCCLNGGR